MVRIRKSTLIAVEYIERGEGGRLPVADETGAQSRQIVPVWNLKRSNWELHTDQRPSERKFESVKAIQIQIKRQTERGRKKEREREREREREMPIELETSTCRANTPVDEFTQGPAEKKP